MRHRGLLQPEADVAALIKSWDPAFVVTVGDNNYPDGNGLGGAPFRAINTPVAGSKVRFTGNYGAMRVEADTQKLTFEFITRNDSLVDRYSLYGTNVMQETVDVNDDWGLVSLPLRPVDSSLAVLFPGGPASAFGYNGSVYSGEDTLSTGRGYWLKFGAAMEVVVAGYHIVADTVEVTAGWNIVPAPSTPAPAGGVTTDPPGLIASRFFGYEAGYAAADTLFPGRPTG